MDIVALLIPSLSSSTVSGLEFITACTSAIKVERASSLRLLPCVFSREDKMFLAECICRSHTPPMWLAVVVFLIETNQSVPLSYRKLLILVWSISLKACIIHSLPPMKLLPLLLLIVQIFSLLAITHRSVMMNESISIKATILIWTALLAKQLKRTPYLFISLRLSFTRNGPKRSTPQ